MAPVLAPSGGRARCCAGETVSVCEIPHVSLLPGLVAGCQVLAGARQPTVTLGT